MSDDRLFPDRIELGQDGTKRKAHYGEGEQPWDIIKRMGFGPEFAAGCVLRYIRRTKDPAHSLESAKWYWAYLCQRPSGWHREDIYLYLRSELTSEEIDKLEN